MTVKKASRDGRRISARLVQMAALLGLGYPVTRIVHGGGANFTFYLADSSVVKLGEKQMTPIATLDLYHCLQDIGQAAEIAFRVQATAA